MKIDKIKELIKDKNIVIPGYLLVNYKKLNIDFKELVFLSIVINELDNNIFDAPYLASRMNLDVVGIMEVISSLCDKKLIEIEVKNIDGNMKEVINIDTIYSKLLLEIVEEPEDKDDSKIYNLIEEEFGRTLSSIECETISGWLNGGISEDLIKAALKEAVLNGVTSLKYIDRILYDWNKKGYKRAKDVKRRTEGKEVNIPDIDWLDEV